MFRGHRQYSRRRQLGSIGHYWPAVQVGHPLPARRDSLLGAALTACVVCISQGAANASQARNALSFGGRFSRLTIVRRRVASQRRTAVVHQARRDLRRARAGQLGTVAWSKYDIIREAKARDCEHVLTMLGGLIGERAAPRARGK